MTSCSGLPSLPWTLRPNDTFCKTMPTWTREQLNRRPQYICLACCLQLINHTNKFNLLKPVATVRTTRRHFQQFYVLPTQRVFRILHGSQNRERLYPVQQRVIGFYNRDGVFTERYGLNPWIQFSFSVSQTLSLAEPFWLRKINTDPRKITTDPGIPAQVNIVSG